MSEERKQSEAILIFFSGACLWLSHFPANQWPDFVGNYDLQKLIVIWNRPILINWPIALLLFLILFFLLDALQKQGMGSRMLRKHKVNSKYHAIR